MDRVSNGIRGFAVVLSDASRFALACAAASAVTLASPAVAQSFSQFTQLPLSDSCEVKPGNPSCTTAVIGTRNTTVLEPFVVTPTQNGYFLDGKVQVDFEGQLQVSGIQTGSFGFTPGQVLGLQAGEVGVGVTTQYVADLHLFNQFYGLEALPSSNFTVNTLDVHSIDVNFENRDFELENGSEGTFSLHSIDPTAISNNGTALSGRFASTDNGIVFGTLSGRANVLTDPGGPIYPMETGIRA
jgi:hypothetical protein